MSTLIRITVSPEGEATLRSMAGAGDRLRTGLRAALAQGLDETASHIKMHLVRGGSWRERRDGRTPLAVRSGSLLGSIASGVEDGGLAGWVGSTAGPASKYARMMLGSGTWTIRPKTARHLWIPIADNLTASGQQRMSPREVMGLTDANGNRRARIFRSKAGNLVVFLPDEKGGTYTKGQRQGQARGKLMFVLRDQVTVKGSDALAEGVSVKMPYVHDLLQRAVVTALQGGEA